MHNQHHGGAGGGGGGQVKLGRSPDSQGGSSAGSSSASSGGTHLPTAAAADSPGPGADYQHVHHHPLLVRDHCYLPPPDDLVGSVYLPAQVSAQVSAPGADAHHQWIGHHAAAAAAAVRFVHQYVTSPPPGPGHVMMTSPLDRATPPLPGRASSPGHVVDDVTDDARMNATAFTRLV